MIIVDITQVMILSVLTDNDTRTYNEGLLRHMVLNNLRSYRTKFKNKYGELVLAFEGKDSWRKKAFPNYKANRAVNRASSGIDWNELYAGFNKMRDEIAENFPYKVMQVNGCEGDDIIAVIAMNDKDNHMIISSDKDYVQLQKYDNVHQYDPRKKIIVNCKNSEAFLREHIIRGDASDGVPNFLSPDDGCISTVKQKCIYKKNMSGWLDVTEDKFLSSLDEETRRRYERNQQLIDFSKIPEEYVDKILEMYRIPSRNSRDKILNYFIKNKLKELILLLHEF